MEGNLMNFYDKLKSEINNDNPVKHIPTPSITNNDYVVKNTLSKERNKLKEGCCKHFLLDIYCKILPLDQEYKDGNMGVMKTDIDSLLQNKQSTAVQYIKSRFDATQAPLLEFMLRAADIIGDNYIKESEETINNAKSNNINIPIPKADIKDKEIEDQLIEVENDTEYKNFIDKLKEKTISKIVTDISKIIIDKKEDKDMTFNSTNIKESAVAVSVDYIYKKLLKENVDLKNVNDDLVMGATIRETTLYEMNSIFKDPGGNFKRFESSINFGHGIIITESFINSLK